MDGNQTLATAYTLKEARKLKRHSGHFDDIQMFLNSSINEIEIVTGEYDIVFPECDGLEVKKLGTKYVTVYADDDEETVFFDENCYVEFRV